MADLGLATVFVDVLYGNGGEFYTSRPTPTLLERIPYINGKISGSNLARMRPFIYGNNITDNQRDFSVM